MSDTIGDTTAARDASVLDRYFGLTRNGTEPRTEIIAGVTTFLTMAYIVFVNPQILGTAGMDKGAVFVATCIAAAASTLVMGLYANYPIALAPGMGLNAFFAFTIVVTYKYSWQQGLAAVFCSGVLFLLISVFPIRQYVIDSIPHNLKLAISAGVGLFLGIIALETSGIIAAHPATLVTLGDLTKPAAIRRDRRGDDAADLFHCHRHRARLHHLRAGKADRRPLLPALAGRDRAGGAVRAEIRGVGVSREARHPSNCMRPPRRLYFH
jgi:ABC-type thiamin/hydroxymethylpyrimidine transport system permease subunit